GIFLAGRGVLVRAALMPETGNPAAARGRDAIPSRDASGRTGGLSMSFAIDRAIAALAFLPAIAFGLAGVESVALAETRVIVVRAFKACFSAEVRITGFLVARAEALVNLDAEGYRVSEVLARAGDRVKEGQDLARLARQGNEGGTPPAGAGPAATT